MKQTLFWALIFLLSACQNQESATNETIEPTVTDSTTDLILGHWSMDSSLFFTNGVNSDVSPAMMPTTWIFKTDGSYFVKNSMTMTGTFSHTGDSLYVVLMAVPNSYEILLLNETNMHLRSTIVEVDTASVQTDAFLTRLAD